MNDIFIIAEISANHNNDINTAYKTIDAIAETGADCVKVQTYTADSSTMNVDNEYFSPQLALKVSKASLAISSLEDEVNSLDIRSRAFPVFVAHVLQGVPILV